MTPERYAKLVGHHKAGAHAVATLADVDGLRAELAAGRDVHEAGMIAEYARERERHAQTQAALDAEKTAHEKTRGERDTALACIQRAEVERLRERAERAESALAELRASLSATGVQPR